MSENPRIPAWRISFLNDRDTEQNLKNQLGMIEENMINNLAKEIDRLNEAIRQMSDSLRARDETIKERDFTIEALKKELDKYKLPGREATDKELKEGEPKSKPMSEKKT